MKYVICVTLILYASLSFAEGIGRDAEIDCHGDYFRGASLLVHSVDDIVRAYQNLAPVKLKALYAQAAHKSEAELTVAEFEHVGDIFYKNQAELVIDHCSQVIHSFSELNGYQVVDETTASFVLALGLRDVGVGIQEVDGVLPFLLGRNVTERTNFVVLAYYCTEAGTPKIASSLATFGIECYGGYYKTLTKD